MPADVQLWLVRDDALNQSELRPVYEAWLSAPERAACAAFAHAHHRWQATVTRALLRWALSQRQPNVRPQDWAFATGAWGKPQVSGPLPRAAAPHFNVTHTEGLIALAVCAPGSGVEVGVDAERLPAQVGQAVERGDEVMGWAELALSATEWAGLQRTPPAQRHRLALRIWTLKEAWAKARGEGLSLPLTELTLWPSVDAASPATSEPALQLSLGPAWADDARHDWTVWAPELPAWPDHLLAVALRRDRTVTSLTASSAGPAISALESATPRLQVWQGAPARGFDPVAGADEAAHPLRLLSTVR